jgi:hypothetical protein
VRSEDNPADFCTRGKSASDLIESSMWWHGPSWLKEDISEWPSTDLAPITDDILRQIESEVRRSEISQTLAVQVGLQDEPPEIFVGIDMRRFSALSRALRITVICLKFIKGKVWSMLTADSRARCANLSTMLIGLSESAHSSASDLYLVKMEWVKVIQSNYFADVVKALTTNEKHALVGQLGLGLDEHGMIRSYSRYDNADMEEESRNPALLPKNSWFTRLIVRDNHERLLHSGVLHTLSETRKEFWIPQGRQLVRRVITQCVPCRKHKNSPFALPRMPSWPRERVSRSAPFQFTGVDYFGPMKVKFQTKDLEKNPVVQVFEASVALFTCLAVRAVHLEYVLSTSAQDFVNCFKRFIARRGTPQQMISDNAPQFRLMKTITDKAWHKILTDEGLLRFSSSKGIDWKYTVELAPWQGGVYERLIGLVKSTIKRAVGRRMLDWQEFITLITEVEAIVNSRPITFVSDDIRSRHCVLRPIDFITEMAVGSPLEFGSAELAGITREKLGEATKRLVAYWKYKQRHLDALWKHWYSEYLLSLRERGNATHHGQKRHVRSHPVVGEIVLVRDEDIPRGSWKIARVQRLHNSSDGKVRAAEIMLPFGRIINRTVNFLYPLEIESDAIGEDGPTEADIDGTTAKANESEGFFTAEDIRRTTAALDEFPNDFECSRHMPTDDASLDMTSICVSERKGLSLKRLNKGRCNILTSLRH